MTILLLVCMTNLDFLLASDFQKNLRNLSKQVSLVTLTTSSLHLGDL